MQSLSIAQAVVIGVSLYLASVVSTNVHTLLTIRFALSRHLVASITSVCFVMALLVSFEIVRELIGV